MSEPVQCPQCGAPLAASSPDGLCPACLLKRALDSHTVGYTEPGANRWLPPRVDELAALFPELEIVRLIGRGGMGAVYEARQKNLDRVVALKILPPDLGHDAAFAERFVREAQAMAKLNHPHIVMIHEFGQRQGPAAPGGMGESPAAATPPLTSGHESPTTFFFLMEFVDGTNLRTLLDSGHIAPREALAIVPQICEALQYAHDRGIVHRDIKPENILLNTQGQVKIADFGLAKLMGRAADPEKIMGTPQYMAPEQLERPADVDHRADIYALGVVFYQMLTGELPVGRFALPSKTLHVDVRLDEVVLKALEREPEKRYQQASEVKTVVETVVQGPAPRPQGESAPPAAAATAAARGAADSSDNDLRERARKDLLTPSVGLRVAAALNGLLLGLPLAALVVAVLFKTNAARHFDRTSITNLRVGFDGLFACGLLLPYALVNILVYTWASRMAALRGYGTAVAAAILGMLAVPANLVGLPMGIWALIVLNRRDVKDAFALTERRPASSRGGPGRTGLFSIPVVGLRHGRRAIYWRGVWTAGLMMAAIVQSGMVLLWFLLLMMYGSWAPAAGFYWVGTVMLTAMTLALGLWNGLHTPLEKLTPLDELRTKPHGVAWVFCLLWIVLCAVIMQTASANVRRPRLATPPVTPISTAPQSAHISSDGKSVYLVHDDTNLHYVFYYPGDFSSQSSGSHQGFQWADNGSLSLKNSARTFGFQRDSSDPDHLMVNGRQFDLKQGRVLVLQDNGTILQATIFPQLAVAKDVKSLALMIQMEQVLNTPPTPNLESPPATTSPEKNP